MKATALAFCSLLVLTGFHCPASTVAYDDFTDTTGLTLNGSAVTTNNGIDGVVLRLAHPPLFTVVPIRSTVPGLHPFRGQRR